MESFRGSLSGSDHSYHSAHGEDHWVHVRNIGQGGFGVVKLFVNQTNNEKIVLKECRLLHLSRETLERWYGEVEILKHLDHPNIVRARNIPEGLVHMPMSNTPFICMEYCDGGDLRQVLRDPENCCGLGEQQIREICQDVYRGIRFLHSRKVIHRDLKPENILLKKVGETKVIYKLTDFGYAKSYDQSSVCTSLVGTMQYVAPEVLKDKKYHSSVDFWSFGVVVFECISGKRPFLHGDPPLALGWIDLVARKGPKDIHIFWGDDETKPVYSSSLARPHRLSSPFEGQITSWLQIALQFNPEMRGGRRVATEDAPCLMNMEHILNTKIVNAVCTSTGDVNSFVGNDSMTVHELRLRVQCSTSVPPSEQYLILPNGYMPQPTESASCFVQHNNTGIVFVFTTALEPSFKMMQHTNPSLDRLITVGDDGIPKDERREVYSHVFFHIREQYTLFEKLHTAHKAILIHITKQSEDIRQEQESLMACYQSVSSLTDFITDMHTSDCSQLKTLHDETRVLPGGVTMRTHTMWKESLAQLQQLARRLSMMGGQVSKLVQETKTHLRLAEELQTLHRGNEVAFTDYYHHFVVRAREIYQDSKTYKGQATVGRMYDVLLGAKQTAEHLIQETLNGHNFGRQFVVQRESLKKLRNTRDNLATIRKEVTEINDQRRKGLWDLLQHERRSSPFTSDMGHASSGNASGDQADVLTYSLTTQAAEKYQRQLSKRSSSGSEVYTTQSSSTSDRYSGRQASVNSSIGSSVDLESSTQLEMSLQRLQRCVSQEENDKVLDKNKELMTRLSSIIDSAQGQTSVNGRIVHPVPEYRQ